MSVIVTNKLFDGGTTNIIQSRDFERGRVVRRKWKDENPPTLSFTEFGHHWYRYYLGLLLVNQFRPCS